MQEAATLHRTKKNAAYSNICAVASPTTSDDCLRITDESVTISSVDNKLLITVPTVHVVGGVNIAMRLVFDRDGLNIYLKDTKIANHVLDVPAYVNYTQRDVDSLLRVMKAVTMCNGILLKSTIDKQCKRNSIVEEWDTICNTGVETRARSPNCNLIAGWSAQKGMCTPCRHHFATVKTSVKQKIIT